MSRAFEKYLRPGVKGTPFCPGCGHRILMNSTLEAIDTLDMDINEMLFVSGIGCAAWIPSPHFNADTLHTLHGRAIPFATGAKLVNPDLCVVVISGDGDLVSIGGNHLIHAARRNTDLKVICANNAIYGMTGGQAGPTTPHGAKTATTPQGNPNRPFDLVQLVKAAGAGYVARFSVAQPEALSQAIQKAMQYKGFSFIEVVSPCYTQFGRRNSFDSPGRMIKELMNRCVDREDAGKRPCTELEDKIITGEFVSCPE